MTIIGNLLENAFNAVAGLTPDRRRVRLRIVEDAGALTIRVADRGKGLDGARAVERGVSTKDGHAGVGLTLVRDAVAAAGGTLSVESTPQGSTFTVSVPMQGD